MEGLKLFLEKGKEWERKATSVPGIFILKLPPYKRSPSQLVVEINPLNTSGTPTKKRGLILRNRQELEQFKKLIGDGKLGGLLQRIEEVNQPAKKTGRPEVGEIIEI